MRSVGRIEVGRLRRDFNLRASPDYAQVATRLSLAKRVAAEEAKENGRQKKKKSTRKREKKRRRVRMQQNEGKGTEESRDAIIVDARARVRTRGRRREWPLIKRRITTPGFVSMPMGSVLRHSVRRVCSRTELLSVYLVAHSHPLLYLRAKENF